ncbi:hypothetical protein DM860_002666 [Cuscuta australis]|uniref:Ubiquitin-like protease family profile domain-containing protein n=1 Tax=Cuscuta australis TaxID=267555 RepID=A0A328D268_9ASTE|nr:hypothetical protein DM860_002666 [Cuscuta australis]
MDGGEAVLDGSVISLFFCLVPKRVVRTFSPSLPPVVSVFLTPTFVFTVAVCVLLASAPSSSDCHSQQSIPAGALCPWSVSSSPIHTPPPYIRCSANKVFMTIHARNRHWVLAELDFPNATIWVYDSLKGAQSKSYVRPIVERLPPLFRTVKTTEEHRSTQPWRVEVAKDVPQQSNGNTCGVMILSWSTSWLAVLQFLFLMKQHAVAPLARLCRYDGLLGHEMEEEKGGKTGWVRTEIEERGEKMVGWD